MTEKLFTGTLNYNKNKKKQNKSSDGPVSFISVQRYVMYCCITYRLQPGVKNMYKKIGQKPSRGQIVKSQKISGFIIALLLDKSKQRKPSQ